MTIQPSQSVKSRGRVHNYRVGAMLERPFFKQLERSFKTDPQLRKYELTMRRATYGCNESGCDVVVRDKRTNKQVVGELKHYPKANLDVGNVHDNLLKKKEMKDNNTSGKALIIFGHVVSNVLPILKENGIELYQRSKLKKGKTVRVKDAVAWFIEYVKTKLAQVVQPLEWSYCVNCPSTSTAHGSSVPIQSVEQAGSHSIDVSSIIVKPVYIIKDGHKLLDIPRMLETIRDALS